MKKICFFTPNLMYLIQKKDGFGGAEIDLWNLANVLGSYGNYQISCAGIGDENKIATADHIQIFEIAKYTSEKKRRGNFVRYLFRLFQAFIKSHADVYFVSTASLEVILALFAARVLRKRIIYKVQHDWETSFQDLRANIFPSIFMTKLFIFFLKQVDVVIAQTYQQAGLLHKNFSLKSVVIYNGQMIPDSQSVYVRDLVLWVGRIHPSKRPEIFLNLVRNFPDQKFVMIAPENQGYSKLNSETKNRASELPNLEFIPGLPADQLAGYYKKAIALVITSFAEGQSNVLVESLKFATPVVSLTHDPDGILERSKIGFYSRNDIRQLGSDLEKLITDHELWSACSKNAYQFALNNFNIDNNIILYRNIIDGL